MGTSSSRGTMDSVCVTAWIGSDRDGMIDLPLGVVFGRSESNHL